jgi:hypothetical protein
MGDIIHDHTDEIIDSGVYQSLLVTAEVNSEVVAEPEGLMSKIERETVHQHTTHISCSDISSINHVKGSACNVVGYGVKATDV